MSIRIYCCYAPEDQELLDDLRSHLKPLARQGLIIISADTDINPGTMRVIEINEYINTAQIILLLVSSDFMASESCDEQTRLALARHRQGNAHVIPIILRPVDWSVSDFHRLEALPERARPLTLWSDRDEGFLSIVNGIRRTVEILSPMRRMIPFSQQPAMGTRNAPDPLAILRILHKFRKPIDKLYIHPRLPGVQLATARGVCNVPADEEILGLIDSTILGSAKECVLFGKEGVYSRTSKGAERIFYYEFPDITFENRGAFVLTNRGRQIGEHLLGERLYGILNEIKVLVQQSQT